MAADPRGPLITLIMVRGIGIVLGSLAVILPNTRSPLIISITSITVINEMSIRREIAIGLLVVFLRSLLLAAITPGTLNRLTISTTSITVMAISQLVAIMPDTLNRLTISTMSITVMVISQLVAIMRATLNRLTISITNIMVINEMGIRREIAIGLLVVFLRSLPLAAITLDTLNHLTISITNITVMAISQVVAIMPVTLSRLTISTISIMAMVINQLVAIMPATLNRLTISITNITVINEMGIRRGIATGLLVVFPRFPQLAAMVQEEHNLPTISNTSNRVTATILGTSALLVAYSIVSSWDNNAFIIRTVVKLKSATPVAIHSVFLPTSLLAMGACFGVLFLFSKGFNFSVFVLTSTFQRWSQLICDSHSSQDLSVNYQPGTHTVSIQVRILLFTVLLNNVDSHLRAATLVMQISSAPTTLLTI